MEYEVDFREQAVDDSALHFTALYQWYSVPNTHSSVNCSVVGLGRVGVSVGTGL